MERYKLMDGHNEGSDINGGHGTWRELDGGIGQQ